MQNPLWIYFFVLKKYIWKFCAIFLFIFAKIMINNIQYHVIHSSKEIEILNDRVSFNYIFDTQLISLLQRNFNLPDSLYILVKDSKENFVGFCSMDKDWWENNYFFIREILIDEKFQWNNIGSELFRRCIQHAKELWANGIVTETDFKNIAMQKLCKKFYFNKWNNPNWKDWITYKLEF